MTPGSSGFGLDDLLNAQSGRGGHLTAKDWFRDHQAAFALNSFASSGSMIWRFVDLRSGPATPGPCDWFETDLERGTTLSTKGVCVRNYLPANSHGAKFGDCNGVPFGEISRAARLRTSFKEHAPFAMANGGL